MKRFQAAGLAGVIFCALLGGVAHANHCDSDEEHNSSGYCRAIRTTTTEAPTTTQAPTTSTTRQVTTTTRPPSTTAAPTTTPTTARASTTTTPEQQASTTTTTAPPAATVVVEPVQEVVRPGEPVTITTQSETTFAQDVAPTVTISGTGDDATTTQAQVIATIDDTGQMVLEVLVPEGTEESIIVVSIKAQDSRGVERTIVYLFPVSSQTSTAASGADVKAAIARIAGEAGVLAFDELAVVPVSEVPAIVRQIQASVPDDETEQELLSALAADPKNTLRVQGTDLVVSSGIPVPTDDEGRPVVAALALAMAGGGLLVLRRRTPSATKEVR